MRYSSRPCSVLAAIGPFTVLQRPETVPGRPELWASPVQLMASSVHTASGGNTMHSDDRKIPGVPEDEDRDRRPNRPEEVELPGEDRTEDLPDDFTDLPGPLDDEDSESGLGGTTDPEASRNRREGLKKDGQ